MGEQELNATVGEVEDQDQDDVENVEEEDDTEEGTVDDEDQPSVFDTIKPELEKRFGPGKTVEEYAKEAFDYASNIERQDQRRANEFKEVMDQIEAIGGKSILKSLANPESYDPMGGIPNDLRGLVKSGQLDPNDPKDALLISAMKELSEIKNKTLQSEVSGAVNTFEGGLEKIGDKYPHADLDNIRGLAYAGAFANIPDDQFWDRVESIAKKEHTRIEGLLKNQNGKKVLRLKDNAKRSLLTSKQVPGTRIRTPFEAFEEEFDKLHGSED